MENKIIIKHYNEYCEREFGNIAETQNNQNNVLGIMYTTLPEHEDEIQVNYDLIKEALIVELATENHTYTYYEPCDQESICDCLDHMDFQMFYSYAHKIVEEVFNLDLKF